MQLWTDVRRFVLVNGGGKREACRQFNIHWDTLQKILAHPEPPGYRQQQPRKKTKLEPFLPVIQQILLDDRGGCQPSCPISLRGSFDLLFQFAS